MILKYDQRVAAASFARSPLNVLLMRKGTPLADAVYTMRIVACDVAPRWTQLLVPSARHRPPILAWSWK